MKDGQESTEVLPGGAVLFEYGPMRMSIQVFEHGRVMTNLAKEGSCRARELLEDLAHFLPVIKRKALELESDERYPDVVRTMIEATRKLEQPDLTPLASVAGAASDGVADFIFLRGGTKIIIDNGGDVALRLREGEVAKVGIKTDIYARFPEYVLSIDETMGIGGVATSGLGGRSFTKGVASAATVLSETASLADGAATVIGNATNVEAPGIRRTLAETLYPDTDIAGEWVTIQVGELSDEKIEEALGAGLETANRLCQKGLIKGALLAVKGRAAWTASLNSWLVKL